MNEKLIIDKVFCMLFNSDKYYKYALMYEVLQIFYFIFVYWEKVIKHK